MNTVLSTAQGSLVDAHVLPDHSVSKHLTHSPRRFITLPLSALSFPLPGSGLRHSQAGSSTAPGRIEFVSYGLVVHLLLLSTPPRGGAVAVGYRPESVCLERTFTSLNARASRRACGEACLTGRTFSFIPRLRLGAAAQPPSSINTRPGKA